MSSVTFLHGLNQEGQAQALGHCRYKLKTTSVSIALYLWLFKIFDGLLSLCVRFCLFTSGWKDCPLLGSGER